MRGECDITLVMKKTLLPLIALSLFATNSFAAGSKALDKSFRYCQDISQVDKLLDRSRESVDRLQAEDLTATILS